MEKYRSGIGPEFADDTSVSSGPFSFFPVKRRAPSCAPEPPPRPVCRDMARCEGCPYAGNGFLCRGRDGKCMRSEVARINHFEIREEPEREDTGDIEQQE